MSISHGLLHHTIIKFIVDHGYAPDVPELAALLNAREDDVTAALHALADYHGVVLHPNSAKIWVVHPFATMPTNFVVRADVGAGEWWGNCAWCSLGVAALLARDCEITTTLGAEGRQATIHIRDGQVVETDYVVHFPIPMLKAWDNVVYTCTTMLLFERAADVERWSARHRIPMGDVQPIENAWAFSKVWYGNHLNPAWHKWSTAEAHAIFERFGLRHQVWSLPVTDTRF
jgi:hypothetical protein